MSDIYFRRGHCTLVPALALAALATALALAALAPASALAFA